MKTVTISTRLTKDEAKRIDQLAKEEGLDRSAFVKKMLRQGVKEFKLSRALTAYRRGKVSLSRAAEIAEMSVRDILSFLAAEKVELNYDLEELQQDMLEDPT